MAFHGFLRIPRMLTELWCEKFEWFDPSPIEPFNLGHDGLEAHPGEMALKPLGVNPNQSNLVVGPVRMDGLEELFDCEKTQPSAAPLLRDLYVADVHEPIRTVIFPTYVGSNSTI